MNNEQILKEIDKLGVKGRVSAVVTSNRGGFSVDVMESYSGGEGLGVTGAVSVLEVTFKSRESAEKLKDLINKKYGGK